MNTNEIMRLADAYAFAAQGYNQKGLDEARAALEAALAQGEPTATDASACVTCIDKKVSSLRREFGDPIYEVKQEPDLSHLKPDTQKAIRGWLADGTFVERAIGVMSEQERDLMTYEKAAPEVKQGEPVAYQRKINGELVKPFVEHYRKFPDQYEPLYTHPAPVNTALQDIEQYRMQMAGICTAALGYWKEGDGVHPDYDTPALREVARLYEQYRAMRHTNTALLEALKSIINDGVH